MPDVTPIPDGYTAITPYLIAEDAAGLLDFLASAFGAVERMRMDMPEGGIGHAEVEIGGAVLMLSDAFPPEHPATKSQLHHYVADVDAAYAPGRERRGHGRRRARRSVLRRPRRPHRRPRRQQLDHRHPRGGRRCGHAHAAHGGDGRRLAGRPGVGQERVQQDVRIDGGDHRPRISSIYASTSSIGIPAIPGRLRMP